MGTDRRSWELDKVRGAATSERTSLHKKTQVFFLWIVRSVLYFIMRSGFRNCCILFRTVLYFIIDLNLYLRSVFAFDAGIFMRSESKFLFICLGGCTQISVYISACVCICVYSGIYLLGNDISKKIINSACACICVIFPHTGL